jgi:dTDP-4-amino-4,6-dideoxygalactose transaminase
MAQLAMNGGPKTRTEPWPGWPMSDETERSALTEVLESGAWGIGGPQVPAMLREFADFHNAEHGIAVTSGTTALETALRAADIGAGCEVIVPPYTFIATANAPIMVGAIPVFADIDPDTYCLDPAAAEAAITPFTRAIIVVHIGGSPCDMDAFMALAEKHNLIVIEDCAQAHGAEWRGRKVGAIGHLGAFSFQSSKNVSAGEGGVILSNRGDLAAKAWSIANVGRVPEGAWYDHRVLGANLRMTEFQAALIRCGLKRLPEHMARRDERAFYLQSRLDGIPGVGYCTMHEGATRNAWHLFIGKYDASEFGGLPRDRFLEAVSAEGIPISRGYNPLYSEGSFQKGWNPEACPFACRFYGGKVDYTTVRCEVAEKACRTEGWWLYQTVLLGTKRDMDDIVAAIEKVRENVAEIPV